jgi:RNA polymerase sigma factor for flagellar operon FliA
VKFAAGRVAARCPNYVDRAELMSMGLFGLIDAIDKFDPDRGAKFESYAITRITGAIIDELRAIDWIPRKVHADARALDDARSNLEHELHRAPSEAELAAKLDIALPRLTYLRSRTATRQILALDGPRNARTDESTDTTLGDAIADPTDAFATIDTVHSLTAAIATLPERDRLVLTLYYYEDLSLAEIGTVLGVTESRVCQINTRALNRLRDQLTDPEPTQTPARSQRLPVPA